MSQGQRRAGKSCEWFLLLLLGGSTSYIGGVPSRRVTWSSASRQNGRETREWKNSFSMQKPKHLWIVESRLKQSHFVFGVPLERTPAGLWGMVLKRGFMLCLLLDFFLIYLLSLWYFLCQTTFLHCVTVPASNFYYSHLKFLYSARWSWYYFYSPWMFKLMHLFSCLFIFLCLCQATYVTYVTPAVRYLHTDFTI